MRSSSLLALTTLALLLGGAAPAQTPPPSPEGPATTRPDWLKRPSFNDMAYAWPRSAAARGVGGRATIKCAVNKQGFLENCSVQSEEPSGEGFGEAALALTPTMLFKPATRNGQPVVSLVSIPVTFRSPGKFLLRDSYILATPSWSKVPNTAQIMAQLDKKVGDKFADGKVVFLCRLQKVTGRLQLCHMVNASEGMTQFKNVGDALTDDFQASPDTLGQVQSWPDNADALVFLPFSFPDMASPAWGARYLTHVQWASLSGSASSFPEAAARAGLKTGVGAVDCLVNDAGHLSDCSVVRESTPGVGFGDMAKKIAEASTINPWTEEGLPAGGARVRVPIQMDYTPPAEAPPAPAPIAKP
jgi:TonB family protein